MEDGKSKSLKVLVRIMEIIIANKECFFDLDCGTE